MARPPKLPTTEPPPSTFVAPSREELMEDVQGAIVRAFEARSEYVRQEADTVTLASLRRMLEKDLNVEGGFLETYRVFVTELIKEFLQGPEEQNPETQETGTVIDEHNKGKEKLTDEHGKGKEPEVESEGNKDEVADPKPKMKRLKKKADTEGIVKDEVMPVQVVNAEEGEVDSLSEGKNEIERRISEAAHKRASHFKSQAETLTVKAVRRLLEQDLEFENGALDTYKELIGAVLDEILNSENPESPENPEDPENEEVVHISSSTGAVTKAKKRKKAAPESTDKPRKKRKPASVEETEKSDSIEGEVTPKIRKRASHKSKKKVVQEEDEDGSGDDSDDGEAKGSPSAEESDDEKTERKKVSKSKVVESKPAYGKKVEHMRSIIKDCGITVPPSVYRKAKQAGEGRRESIMVMELETILRKEGLTASASKDEIKAVRKRKEKLKDLEGIDTSNIIEESRGRRSRTSANSFFAPQRNDPIDLGDENEDEDEDEDGDEDEDDNSEGDPNVELQDDDDDED